jgi:hypothetical protein
MGEHWVSIPLVGGGEVVAREGPGRGGVAGAGAAGLGGGAGTPPAGRGRATLRRRSRPPSGPARRPR